MASKSIQFEIQERDVVRATGFAATHWLPISPHLFAGIAFLVALGTAWGFRAHQGSLAVELAYLLIAVVLAFMLVLHVILPWHARRHYCELAAAHGTTSVDWDAQGISIRGEKGQTRLEWSDFFGWSEQRDLLLLFQSHRLFNLLPKSVLSKEQLAEIRSHLKAAGVKKL